MDNANADPAILLGVDVAAHSASTTVNVDAFASPVVCFIPIGSFEQHGPYLPLATDSLIALGIANRLAQTVPGVVVPPIPVSCSQEHSEWPGTISVSTLNAVAYVKNVIEAALGAGFDRVVMVNGHGGNYFLSNVAQEVNSVARKALLFPTRETRRVSYEEAGLVSSPEVDIHAGEYEHSLALALGFAHNKATPIDDTTVKNTELLTLAGFGAFTSSGIVGTPSFASKDKGVQLLNSLAGSFERLWSEWANLQE